MLEWAAHLVLLPHKLGPISPDLREGRMSYTFHAEGERRLEGYFDRVGRVLGRKDRREAFCALRDGAVRDVERKSVEPMAAAACGDPDRCRAVTERLLHFVGESGWDDRGVRLCASRYAIAEMVKREPVDAWIFDDTGFIKQGDKSPGGCSGSTRGRLARRQTARLASASQSRRAPWSYRSTWTLSSRELGRRPDALSRGAHP